MTGIKCLCSNCSKSCSSNLKTELALKGLLTYIYLKNGYKLTNTCKLFEGQENSFISATVFLGREGLMKII